MKKVFGSVALAYAVAVISSLSAIITVFLMVLISQFRLKLQYLLFGCR